MSVRTGGTLEKFSAELPPTAGGSGGVLSTSMVLVETFLRGRASSQFGVPVDSGDDV
jgi:hypothetical protein